MGQASRGKWERRKARGVLSQFKEHVFTPQALKQHAESDLTCPRKCKAKHPKKQIS